MPWEGFYMITAAQKEFRSSRIGGSDVAAIRGNSKFFGRAKVQQRIKGIAQDRGYEQRYNANFEFGNRLESIVAEVFAENHPELLVVTVEEAHANGLLEKLDGFKGVVHELADGSVSITHLDYEYMVLNLDYLLIDKRNPLMWGVLEIKTASEYVSQDWGQTGTDQVPSYYLDQPMYYAGGIGAAFIRVAVQIGLRDYREYNIAYDRELYEAILNDVVSFYANHIVFGKPVTDIVDASKGNYLATRDRTLASPEALEALRRRKAIDEKLKPLQKAREKADAAVKAYLGDAHQLVDAKGEVLFQVSEHDALTLDKAALKRDYPDLYSRYSVKEASRRTSVGKAYKKLQVKEDARKWVPKTSKVA
jgi:predicted phage-related endonuclease